MCLVEIDNMLFRFSNVLMCGGKSNGNVRLFHIHNLPNNSSNEVQV